MFSLPPDAYASHHTAGRFRIRIPSKKGDAAFFESLKALGGQFPNIHEVQVNPVTGSLLIKHSLDPATMEELARKYFPEQARQIDSPSSNIHRQVTETYHQVDTKIKKFTGGEMDVGTLIVKPDCVRQEESHGRGTGKNRDRDGGNHWEGRHFR
jgi:hypothetical protein